MQLISNFFFLFSFEILNNFTFNIFFFSIKIVSTVSCFFLSFFLKYVSIFSCEILTKFNGTQCKNENQKMEQQIIKLSRPQLSLPSLQPPRMGVIESRFPCLLNLK